MFGFLNPRPHSADYRRAYARLCQHQRRGYGLWALPFHSYEAVFLYQCALDCGAFPAAVMPRVRCCRLAAPTSLPRDPDAAVGRFCASVALLLTAIKLEDDVRDSHGLPARLASWLLRKRIGRAQAYFTRLDGRFGLNVDRLVADHHALEQRASPVALAEYVEPTALSFGYVFGLMSRLPGLAHRKEILTELGRKLGAAIIAFDCAVDWTRDRRRGEYNPLPDESAAAGAMLFAAYRLGEAVVIAWREFGETSRAAATLVAVRKRVLMRDPLAETVPCPVHRPGIVARLRRALSFVAVPVMASAGGPTEPVAPGPGLPGQPPGLPGGIENAPSEETIKKGRDCGESCCQCGDCGCNAADCGCTGLDLCHGCNGCGGCSSAGDAGGGCCDGCNCDCNC